MAKAWDVPTAFAQAEVGLETAGQGEHAVVGDPVAVGQARAQAFEFGAGAAGIAVSVGEEGVLLRVAPAGGHAAAQLAQPEGAPGLLAAARGSFEGEFADAAGEARDVAFAAVEFDIDAAQALVHGFHLAFRFGAGGDGGGEAGAGGGQHGIGALGFIHAGGQQLGGFDAVQAGAQGVGFFLGGVEFGAQLLQVGVDAVHVGLALLEAGAAGQFAKMEVGGFAQVAGAAAFAVVAVRGDPLGFARQAAGGVGVGDALDAAQQVGLGMPGAGAEEAFVGGDVQVEAGGMDVLAQFVA